MRIAKTILLLTVSLLFLTSCMTFLDTEPTIVGGWKAVDGDFTYTRYFTAEGTYVLEKESDTFAFYEFGSYEADDVSLFMQSYGTFDYALEGRTLYLDGLTYTKTTSKAVDNTAKLAGVWENDRYTIGFATDGLVVSQGSYMNCKDYELDDDHILINGKSTQFIVVNNNLYIRRFDFLKAGNTIRLKRVSSGGKDKTGMDILCNNGPWFYQDLGSYDLTGTLYTFSLNGTYKGVDYNGGLAGKTSSGTFVLDGNRIRLSSGDVLVFAYIDSTPFGYT